MKSFTDNAGPIWTVAVNVAAIKRVCAICDVDLKVIGEKGAILWNNILVNEL